MAHYTTKQAAQKLGISASTLRKHIYKTGLLRPYAIKVKHKLVGGWPIGSLIFSDKNIAIMKKILAHLPGPGQTELTRIEVTARQRRALQLQEAGWTRSEIAKELGFKSGSAVTRAIHAIVKKSMRAHVTSASG